MNNLFQEFVDKYAQIISDVYNQVSRNPNEVNQTYYNDEYNYIITKIDSTKFTLTRAIKPYNDLIQWDITTECIDPSVLFEHILIESYDHEEPDQIVDLQSISIMDSFLSIQEKM